jgi:hypothetical protein
MQHLTGFVQIVVKTSMSTAYGIAGHVCELADCNSFNSQFFDISQQPIHSEWGTYPPIAVEKRARRG